MLLEEILNKIKDNTIGVTLDLSKMLIDTPIQSDKLSEALKTNTSITHLTTGSRLKEYGIYVLSEALKTNTSITHLDITGNQLTDYTIRTLFEALKTNTSITDLNLRYNDIKGDNKNLFSDLGANTSITHLNIEGNKCGKFIASLSEALKTNTTITHLNITGNQLTDYTIRTLFEALKTNTTITDLNLGHNDIKGDDKNLFSDLSTNTTITHLNIEGNQCGGQFIASLSEALKTNTSITHLNINFNDITNIISILSEALKTNKTVREINLDYSSIGQDGIESLFSMIGYKLAKGEQPLDFVEHSNNKAFVNYVKYVQSDSTEVEPILEIVREDHDLTICKLFWSFINKGNSEMQKILVYNIDQILHNIVRHHKINSDTFTIVKQFIELKDKNDCPLVNVNKKIDNSTILNYYSQQLEMVKFLLLNGAHEVLEEKEFQEQNVIVCNGEIKDISLIQAVTRAYSGLTEKQKVIVREELTNKEQVNDSKTASNIWNVLLGKIYENSNTVEIKREFTHKELQTVYAHWSVDGFIVKEESIPLTKHIGYIICKSVVELAPTLVIEAMGETANE